jgi:hypothetical protein
MSISDQAPVVGQDSRVTPRANRPKRRTFTASYKAKILEEFDALPEGGSERGALLRREGLYHSHLDNWRQARNSGALKGLSPKPGTDADTGASGDAGADAGRESPCLPTWPAGEEMTPAPVRPSDAAGYPRWPLEDARVSARLADGTPIRPEQARIIALNAGVSALVLGPDGIPLYLGRRARLVTSGQRVVLEALYQTCACDECDIPVRFCQLDHVFNLDRRRNDRYRRSSPGVFLP